MTAFGMFLAAIWFGLIVFSLMINNNKRISLSNDKAGRCWGRATIKDVQEKKEPQDTIMKTGIPSFCLCVFHRSGIMTAYEPHHQINGKRNEAPVFTSFRRTGRRRLRYLFSSVFLAKRDAEASNERGQERRFMTLNEVDNQGCVQHTSFPGSLFYPSL